MNDRVDADAQTPLPTVRHMDSGPVAPTVSVVICAYTQDRWSSLLAACASVRRQLGAADELLVVIDHNEALLARARTTLAGVRVLASLGPAGLSGARNTGVAASRGDAVAFLDDDATARPGWLEQLRGTFRDHSVSVVGTSVNPRWQGTRAPRWFPAEFGWVVGCGYRGLPTRRGPVRNPIGASMAVRRSAFAVAGGFSEAVGRIGSLPTGCEETEFCIRLVRTSPHAAVVHEPGAAVDHFVPTDRQTLRYFLRRCFYEGRSKSAVVRLQGPRTALSAERRYVRAVLPAAVARGLAAGVLRRDPAALLRAAAVVVGLTATVGGFVWDRARLSWRPG